MKEEKGNRRSFLKHVVAGTTVVAAMATVKVAKAEPTTKEKPTESLYFESENFKNYYSKL